jgi:translin
VNWDQLRERTQELHEVREKILVECRKLGQLSAKSIRQVHRRNFVEAQNLLAQSQASAVIVRELMVGRPQLSLSYLHDTEKEMVEAAVVLAIVLNQEIPTSDALGAQTMAYLHGCTEAASEVRRYVLDEVRAGRMDEAERIMQAMDDIYEEMITFDFPDSLTHGLRRAVDALRAVLERTRSDLTLTASQLVLVAELRKASLER